MLPERIKLSQRTTDKLRYLKSQIGVAPNILARFSIMLAIKEGGNLKNTGTLDTEGLELNKSTLFERTCLRLRGTNKAVYSRQLP